MLKENISTFDFFNHLISGFLLLFLLAGPAQTESAGAGFAGFTSSVPVQLVLVFACALVCGHLLTEFSYWSIQVLCIRRLLGSPDQHALNPDSVPALSRVFGFYYRKLSNDSRKALEQAARRCKMKIEQPGFLSHAYFTVRQSGVANQLDIFQNNYVFSRNLLLLVPLAVLQYGSLAAGAMGWPAVIIVALTLEILLFVRLLRFLRAHFSEVVGLYSRVARPVTAA